MSNVVKFPFSVSRRAHARLPRASKNGTPEEREAVRKLAVEEIAAIKIEEEADCATNDRRPDRPLSVTAENGRLRIERWEDWRMAEAATRYWRMRLKFHETVSRVQDLDMPEGHNHPTVKSDDRWPLLDNWRAAIGKQLLTPAPDAAAVKWKQLTLAGDQHRYTGVKSERIERAIADDLEFLAAHPVRQSRRRKEQR
jgi:hypothetical protein